MIGYCADVPGTIYWRLASGGSAQGHEGVRGPAEGGTGHGTLRPSHRVGITRGSDGDRGATGVTRAGELANGTRCAPRSVESPGECHRSEVRVSLAHTATRVAHDVDGSGAVHGDI